MFVVFYCTFSWLGVGLHHSNSIGVVPSGNPGSATVELLISRTDIKSYPANFYPVLVYHVHFGADKVDSTAFRTSALFRVVVVVRTLLIRVNSVQSSHFKPDPWPTLASTMERLVKVLLGPVLSELTLKWILQHFFEKAVHVEGICRIFVLHIGCFRNFIGSLRFDFNINKIQTAFGA